MPCENKITLPPGQKSVFIGCSKEHISTSKAIEFVCGESFTWTDCKVNHMWRCQDCSSKIPSGKGLKHSPPLSRSTPTRSPPTQPCPNTIEVAEVTEDTFLPNCNVKHSFGPSIYKCGSQMDFLSCPKEHFIWCLDCGGKPLPQPSSSTPARPNTTKNLQDLKDTVNNLSKILEDEGNEKEDLKDSCSDKQHLFEQRTKKFLSAPARQFMQAYRTCKFHFYENKELISKEFGDNILQKLINAFQEVEKVRSFCLEPFSEEEIHQRTD